MSGRYHDDFHYQDNGDLGDVFYWNHLGHSSSRGPNQGLHLGHISDRLDALVFPVERPLC